MAATAYQGVGDLRCPSALHEVPLAVVAIVRVHRAHDQALGHAQVAAIEPAGEHPVPVRPEQPDERSGLGRFLDRARRVADRTAGEQPDAGALSARW